MMQETRNLQRRQGYIGTGAVGLVLSAAYLGMALQLPMGTLAQPGAAVFPIISGAILVLGSLAAIWEGWRTPAQVTVELPAGADLRRLLALIILLAVYLAAVPWLGQLPASVVFCIILMRILSSLGWVRIVLYSLALSVGTYLLFVVFLKVPMPRGMLAF